MTGSGPLRVLHVKAGGWGVGGVEAFVASVASGLDASLVATDVLTIIEQGQASVRGYVDEQGQASVRGVVDEQGQVSVRGVVDEQGQVSVRGVVDEQGQASVRGRVDEQGQVPVRGRVDEQVARAGGRRFSHVDAGRGPGAAKLGSLVALARLVRSQRYRTVHVHTGSPYHVGYALAARLGGARTVILHSHTAERRPVPPSLRRLLDLALDRVPTHRFACSADAASSLFPAARPGAVQVVRNGVDLDALRFDPAVRARKRADLGLSAGRLVVGSVGRLSWEKNQATLLAAFAAFARTATGPSPVLVVVGDGPDRAELERQAAESGIDVRFLGTRSDVPALLAAMDVFVLPSFSEGLGIAAVEAQASGLACVLSCGVPAEVDLTGACEFVDATAPARDWVAALARAADRPAGARAEGVDLVRAAGYAASDVAAWLQDFYLRPPLRPHRLRPH